MKKSSLEKQVLLSSARWTIHWGSKVVDRSDYEMMGRYSQFVVQIWLASLKLLHIHPPLWHCMPLFADPFREWHGWGVERNGTAGDSCLYAWAGGPSVPISQAGTCQATSTKVEAGTVFPILLHGNGNVKEKYPSFGGRGGMYHGMTTLPMHVQVRGYFQFGQWQERLASISKYTDAFKISKIQDYQKIFLAMVVFRKTPIIWRCFRHPSILLQELKSYLLIIKKIQMISAMKLFFFRNLSCKI